MAGRPVKFPKVFAAAEVGSCAGGARSGRDGGGEAIVHLLGLSTGVSVYSTSVSAAIDGNTIV